MSNVQPQSIIVQSTKSVGLAIILTVLFGPLGMFYSTIIGGIIMTLISIPVGLLTFGIGLIFTWPICIIWGALAAAGFNKKLFNGMK